MGLGEGGRKRAAVMWHLVGLPSYHYTMYYCRPVGSGNTVVRVFRPWSSVLDNNRRRVASLKCFIFSEKVLELLIQFSRRLKEEV
jgi:hypothetical protein